MLILFQHIAGLSCTEPMHRFRNIFEILHTHIQCGNRCFTWYLKSLQLCELMWWMIHFVRIKGIQNIIQAQVLQVFFFCLYVFFYFSVSSGFCISENSPSVASEFSRQHRLKADVKSIWFSWKTWIQEINRLSVSERVSQPGEIRRGCLFMWLVLSWMPRRVKWSHKS